MSFSRIGLLAGVAACCLSVQSVLADTAEQDVIATTQHTTAGLAEIVVTARRREENLQSVPIAVTAHTGEFLDQHQITDLFSLQNVTPSLQSESSSLYPNAPVFAIRGIGTSVAGVQVESSVGVVVDDVPLMRANLGDIEFFDLSRAEVLRGPQGMLFGKNASAGVISIVTSDPVLDKTDFLAHAQYGYVQNAPSAGNQTRVDAAVNIPMGASAALRIGGYFTEDPAYVKNVYTSEDQDLGLKREAVRAKFLWEPTNGIRVLLAGDYATSSGQGETAFTYRSASAVSCSPFAGCPRVAPPGPGYVATALAGVGVTASPSNLYTAAIDPNTDHYHVAGVSLKTDFDLGGGYTLTNIAAYRNAATRDVRDGGGIPVPNFAPDEADYSFSQTSDELRLTSPLSQRFTYQAGFYYLNFNTNAFSFESSNFALPPPPAPLSLTAETIAFGEHAKSVAGYFEGQYSILNSLRLTAGVRYTRDTQSYTSQLINEPFTLISYFPCQPPFVPASPTAQPCFLHANSSDNDNVSFRFGLNYDIASDVMAYLTYTRGYKGPTFDAISADLVGPEIPHVWELGLKSTMLDDKLRLNLALFHEVFKGFQTQVTQQVGGAIAVLTVNAGELQAQGVELEFTAIPVNGLTLSGGVTYNSTKYTGLPNIPCYPGQPVGTGTNQCFGLPANGGLPYYPLGAQNVNGDRLEQAPLWTGVLTARYEMPVWGTWNGFIQGDAHAQSPMNFTVGDNPYTRIGSVPLYGLSTGVNNRHTTVTLFVRNLADKRVPGLIGPTVATGIVGDGFLLFGTGDYLQNFGDSSFRTIGLSVDYRL